MNNLKIRKIKKAAIKYLAERPGGIGDLVSWHFESLEAQVMNAGEPDDFVREDHPQCALDQKCISSAGSARQSA